jgi:hypothetical protein
VEIPTLIPATQISAEQVRVRIEPVATGTVIFPYRHWLYAGDYETTLIENAVVSFQDGEILLTPIISFEDGLLTVKLEWRNGGSSRGDLIALVHLYAEVDSPPVAQSDLRPGGGALSPGAWLPGLLTDQIVLDLRELPAGKYTLAVGLYDAATLEIFVRRGLCGKNLCS